MKPPKIKEGEGSVTAVSQREMPKRFQESAVNPDVRRFREEFRTRSDISTADLPWGLDLYEALVKETTPPNSSSENVRLGRVPQGYKLVSPIPFAYWAEGPEEGESILQRACMGR